MSAPFRFAMVVLLLLGASRECAQAQVQDYPNRSVTFVVPFAPGGSTDILARLVGQKLEQRLGKPFVIENRPGAGSVTATVAVARGAADGYMILMAHSGSMAINVGLYKKLTYDPVSDFVPVALLVKTPFVLVVNPSLPVDSVAALIKLAREKPGQISFASVGPGTPHHLYAELLKAMTGIEMTHVPYRGTAPALNDVVAGHIPLMFSDIAPARELIAAGKVRPIGVSSKDRVAAIADVPPIAETGVPGFDTASWQMMVAPAATPKDIVDKLHAELKSILAQSDIKEQIIKMGMLAVDTPSVADLQSFVKSEIARWGKVVEQAGIAGSQ